MKTRIAFTLAAAAATALAGHAAAGFNYSQTATQDPTYTNVINFDGPGAPTGLVAGNTWASTGLASLTDGANPGVPIGDVSASFPWISTGNVADGSAFGLFMTWGANDATELSFQMWTPAGPGGPFGGYSVLLADANDNVLAGWTVTTPIWGGQGDSWINITTTGGSTFKKAVILYGGFGLAPPVFVDNISFNTVPTPGAIAFLGLGALGCGRRRR